MSDIAAGIIGLICIIILSVKVYAQEVQYCYNPQTDHTVVIQKGMPCPFGYY